MSFLIEHDNSVQFRGIFKGAALKFPFFLVTFSFGNEREENSARRANTARLRAIAKERYGKDGYTQFFLTESCHCGSPHPNALGVTSTELVIAHSTAPKARARLRRVI